MSRGETSVKSTLVIVLIAAVAGALYMALKQPEPSSGGPSGQAKPKVERPASPEQVADNPPPQGEEEGAEPVASPSDPEIVVPPSRPSGLEVFQSQRSTGEPVTPKRPWGGLEPVGLPALGGVSLAMDHESFMKSRPQVKHVGGDPKKDWSINYKESSPMKGVSAVHYQFNRKSQEGEPFLNSMRVVLDVNEVGGFPVWKEMQETVSEAGWGAEPQLMEETDRQRLYWQNRDWSGSLSVHRETGELEWNVEFREPPQDP